MNSDTEALIYAIVKQLGSAYALSTDYGDLELDEEMQAAVQAALTPILERRLDEAQGSTK